jgi:site-specific recombinase XerD
MNSIFAGPAEADRGQFPDPVTFAAAASQAAWRRSASIVTPHTADTIISVVTVDAPGRYAAVAIARAIVSGALGAYLHDERPREARTDRVFVVLKGPRRGLPLSAEGLDEILAGARRRAGLEHATCHELRHTCLTRLKGAELHRMQHSGPGVSTAP